MTPLHQPKRVGVIHLVRAANGTAPLSRFLRSLAEHDAGCEYELVLVLKGFTAHQVPQEYETLLGGLPHTPLFMHDAGFDIGAYFFAARRVACEHVCFLNSFSRILHSGWLRSFDEALAKPRIGVVGATGSAETPRGAICGSRSLHAILQSTNPRGWYRTVAFPPFPNYHIRSNAFFLSRATFLSLSPGMLRSKRDMYRFESGRRSMTRQLAARGLEARVVGRDGASYPPEAWATCATFRSGDQENLLVADNRTTDYFEADPVRRQMLAQAAWGPNAIAQQAVTQ